MPAMCCMSQHAMLWALLLSCHGLTYAGLTLCALRVHRLGLEQFQGTGLPGDHLSLASMVHRVIMACCNSRCTPWSAPSQGLIPGHMTVR